MGDDASGRYEPLPVSLRIVDIADSCGALLFVVLVLCGGLLIGVMTAAQAETPSHGIKREDPINFNIPAQPLTDALYAFTTATGIEALAAGTLLANPPLRRGPWNADRRRSAANTLAGSGLTARFVDPGSFTLAPIQTSLAPSVADAPSDIPRYTAYSIKVQNAVKRALCRQTDTHPGDYRTAIQIWIAPSGQWPARCSPVRR